MSKRLRRLLAAFAILVTGLVAAVAVFLYTADYNRYKGLIADAVTDMTGRQLTIKGDLTIAMSLPPELAVADVTLANASWGSQPQMAKVGELRIGIRVLQLLRKEIDISRIRLIDTALLFETGAGGQSNWQFSRKPDARKSADIRGVAVRQLEVENLTVTVRGGDAASPAAQYTVDTLTLTRNTAADSLSVALQGSSNGQAVALSGQTGPIADLLAGSRFPVALSGDVAGATVKLDGEIGNALKLEGLDLTVQASGTDLAKLGTPAGVDIPTTDSFEVTAKLSGSGTDLNVAQARASVSHQDIKFAASGQIGKLNTLEGIALELTGSGHDLAELGSIIGTTLPKTGPFAIDGKLTGSVKALALSEAQGSIGAQSIKVSLAGKIGDLVALENIDLNVKASGNDVAELGPVIDQTLPKTGPFQVSGQLTGSTKVLALNQAQGTISEQSIKVSLTGKVDDLIAVEGVDLKVKGSGDDVAQLGTILGKTLPKTGPFEISGRLAGSAKALALSQAQGTISEQSIKVSLAGAIDDLITQKGISLDVKGAGKSLGELRGILGDKLPDTGPFVATARLTGSAEAPAISKLNATVAYGDSQLAISGELGDLLQLTGINLNVQASGKNLGELGPLLDKKLPELGAFRVQGQLSGSDQLIDLKGFSATIDKSDFTGWAKAEFGKRPKITARLESAVVDFTRIMAQTQGNKDAAGDAAKGKTREPRQRLFSDEPLPFDVLEAVDADIGFSARNIKARDAELAFGQLTLGLTAGDLQVEKLEATYEGAKISVKLNLKAGKPSTADLKFLVQGFDLGRFLKETQTSQEVAGRVDVAANLTSQGDSPHHLMANLDGDFGAVFGKGEVPRILDLLASDLAARVVPIWGRHKKAGQLNCGLIQFTNKAGIATSDAFVFDTQIGIIKGDGEINFDTEQLDFVLSPKPKDASLFSLATKLRVTGSVLDPKVRPTGGAMAKKGGKALGALVVGPAGLLLPFLKTGARNQHPCDIEALTQRVQSIYN